ncbi:MAG: hypothetical protein ACRD2G_13095 [Terriglobia bacterium]
MGISITQLVPTSTQPQATALTEQIDALTAVINLLREHLSALMTLPGQVEGLSLQLEQGVALLESLVQRQDAAETQIARIDERTQRLTPAHARAIQEMVDRIVRETKHLPIPLTYTIIYGRLKHRFRAGSYREIPDDRYDALLTYLRDELHNAASGAAPEQERLL